ncbi:MAG: phosphopantetheine-binding protein [Clostridium sp.]|jgi:acyl carrier protein|nr:phosphopantetheine-binding protein [Clostridium sp.]
MDKQHLVNCIFEIIKSNGLIKNDVEINENTSLYNECGINSIDIIDLIVCIEEKFNFEFNNTNLVLKDFESVSRIADIVLVQLPSAE